MSNASAHNHGIRSRHRNNDPAKRIHLEEVDIPISLVVDIPTHDDDVLVSRSDSSSNENMSVRADSTNSTITIPNTNTTSTNSSSSSSSSLPLPPLTPITTPSKPIPMPLDLSISNSLTNGCMIYLTTLLSTEEFIYDCLPFSLLLTTSTSYSTLLSNSIQLNNFTNINNLISYTSNNNNSERCENYIKIIEDNLNSNKNCGIDLNQNKNQVIKQTKNSLGNYKLIKKISNLINEETGIYCYLENVKSKRPDDAYLWNLPSGIPLPDKSIPTCSSCSRSILNTYSEFTSTTPTLNSTLVKQAMSRVNDACGASFVNLSAVALSNTSTRSASVNSLFLCPLGWFLGVLLSVFSLIWI
nr:uncharacterized protein I206_04374 [Kwoniella pini CBS 10737]OCF49847.1 hypothetical protein I206_04374 [Kwoniella pini CBS 10737]